VAIVTKGAEHVTVRKIRMIKTWFKKITGIQAIEDAKAQAEAERIVAEKLANQAIAAAAEAKELEQRAKETPKERATALGEPWVAVLDTHVNKDNIRNGFFELDWNDEFIVQLKQAGYGFEGDPEEEIVDRWFRELAYNMLTEAGVAEPERVTGGFINVNKLGNGKASVE
jgi:hypothetical protein